MAVAAMVLLVVLLVLAEWWAAIELGPCLPND